MLLFQVLYNLVEWPTQAGSLSLSLGNLCLSYVLCSISNSNEAPCHCSRCCTTWLSGRLGQAAYPCL